ncbi:MAG: fused MFS/spermidine synthase [bacterium]
MYAKKILPVLGGTPAVWNTCVVFYQVVLLAGYAYVHGSVRWLGVRRQIFCHLGLLIVVLFTLGAQVPENWIPSATGNPVLCVFFLLLVSLGPPFFVLSTCAPLLQRWFASTSHRSAKDAYYFYAVSNTGSMAGLLGYPFFLEPRLALLTQTAVWIAGYVLLAGMIAGCAFLVLRFLKNSGHDGIHDSAKECLPALECTRVAESVGNRQRIRWVLLAFVPSSLLLAVTNYITSEITEIPLLWTVPLSLYLMTFVLSFARKRIISHHLMLRVQPILLLLLMLSLSVAHARMMLAFLPLHLLAFFVTAMVCHGELANSRPPSAYLTEFYLWLSIGGALGGMFNALIAPVIFESILEYPLAVVLACLLRPSSHSGERFLHGRWFDYGLVILFGISLVGFSLWLGPLGKVEGRVAANVALVAVFSISALLSLVCWRFASRPMFLGLSALAIMLAGFLWSGGQDETLYSERNFFGMFKVVRDTESHCNLLYHGRILHGAQSLDPARRGEPLAYHHPTGPLGQVFEAFSHKTEAKNVAVVGLGAGAVACYAKPGQHWTFYEINPAIEEVARDTRYFTYLSQCPAKIDVVLGDARISLAQARNSRYDLIIFDAFSSGAIPVHLLTREALNLYLSRLSEGGMLVFNVSNRYLRVKDVVGDLAEDAGLACVYREDRNNDEALEKAGKTKSSWVAMARRLSDLGSLVDDDRWKALAGRVDSRVWTDDYSNILSVLRWKK